MAFGGGSFFGGQGTTTTTQQQQQPSIFGAATAKPAFSFGQSTTQPAQSTGIFGASAQPAQQQQPTTNLFGTTQQPQTQPTPSLFGASSFGATQNQNQLNQSQQQQQRPLDQTLRFGHGDSQQTVAQAQEAKEPWWQENKGMGMMRSIPQQMALIKDKWDPASLNSPLRTYLYQYVGSESEALKYTPSADEDAGKWEEAVQKRPGPEWVPVLARGFKELAQRGVVQVEQIKRCNMMLHEINASLDIQLDKHRQDVAARLAKCKQQHKATSQRALALAAKVQILKNRGYVMDNAEEELKLKLSTLESSIFDPTLNARQQEIWAHMMGIRERSRYLKAEMEKLQPVAETEQPLLDDDQMKQARKVSPHRAVSRIFLTLLSDT